MYGTDDRPTDPAPTSGRSGGVVGIVSIGDVVKFKSEQQSFEIKFLHECIGAR
jgi:hypothetical protein